MVERLSAWVNRNRRLCKDPEATLASAKACLDAAAVMILVRRLGRPARLLGRALRSYVEAIGGELELIVRLPSHAPLRLERLRDVTRSAEVPDAQQAKRRTKARTAAWGLHDQGVECSPMAQR